MSGSEGNPSVPYPQPYSQGQEGDTKEHILPVCNGPCAHYAETGKGETVQMLPLARILKMMWSTGSYDITALRRRVWK